MPIFTLIASLPPGRPVTVAQLAQHLTSFKTRGERSSGPRNLIALNLLTCLYAFVHLKFFSYQLYLCLGRSYEVLAHLRNSLLYIHRTEDFIYCTDELALLW